MGKLQYGADLSYRNIPNDRKRPHALRLTLRRKPQPSSTFSILKQPENELAEKHQIEPALRDQFAKALQSFVESFKAQQAQVVLPDGPERDYIPRESIIDYLLDSEGFGPWHEAGVLTRPLIREKQPKAYMALSNWLRNNELPAGLSIPTKSDTVTARLEAIAGQPISPEKRALAASLERGLRHTLR